MCPTASSDDFQRNNKGNRSLLVRSWSVESLKSSCAVFLLAIPTGAPRECAGAGVATVATAVTRAVAAAFAVTEQVMAADAVAADSRVDHSKCAPSRAFSTSCFLSLIARN